MPSGGRPPWRARIATDLPCLTSPGVVPVALAHRGERGSQHLGGRPAHPDPVRVALAYRGERGSQPRFRAIVADHLAAWRSPTVASEDRNTSLTGLVVSATARGARPPWRARIATGRASMTGRIRNWWRSPTVASADRNEIERAVLRSAMPAGGARPPWRARIATTSAGKSTRAPSTWRSPTVASEAATAWRWATRRRCGRWRSPTVASEDRNPESMGTLPAAIAGGARPPWRARIATLATSRR